MSRQQTVGNFITFEGGEGCGKSTQVGLLSEALRNAGIPVLKTREPGGSAGAERIRQLLVSGDKDAWDPVAETLLFYAARMDHVSTLIKPALARGETVICDRFADSTRVYQGIGKKVPEAFISNLHRLSLDSFVPNLTIILDIDPAIGLERANARNGNENRFESMNFSFHQAVRDGFLAIAKREVDRCVVVDASQSIESIQEHIRHAIKSRLQLAI